jgi:4-hydroxy-tetrahydrodipicolinate reductase
MQSEGIELAGGFDHPGHPQTGRDLSEIIGGPSTGLIVRRNISEVLDSSDVVIDFTSASVSLQNFREAASRKKPMVIGSTGITAEQASEVKELARQVACVWAPNMARGVNVLFKAVADVARLLGEEFDIEIMEAHHKLKKDAPSGTAVRLGEVAAESLGWRLDEVGVFERHGLIGERKKKEIGIQTIRAGDIVGEHTIIFAGPGERIELSHKAHSRDNFAQGAIHAARWVVRQPPGLYDMQHILGIK